jgi:hypothetical protein
MITIFCEKISVFLKNSMLWSIFFALFSFVSSQKRQFFAKYLGENILKIDIGPWTIASKYFIPR